MLYPHYLAPVPSCMVAQFACQPDLRAPVAAAGRHSRSTPSRCAASRCRFRTASPVTLWPIEVENVRLSGLPLAAPANPLAAGAVGVLRITLKCATPEVTFAQLGVDRLRFFLRGPPTRRCRCTNCSCAHAVSVA